MIRWDRIPRIPAEVAAALESLRFREPSTTALDALDEAAWARLLSFSDRAHFTLALDARGRPEIESRRERNAERYRRLLAAYDEIAAVLDSFVVLKGFTLAPAFIPDARLRQQYDLDLFCPPEALLAARDALLGLGYEPFEGADSLPVDHLPVMVRKTDWQWREDYFDPEVPVSVDLHFRFWDPDTEKFDAPGVEEFWTRHVEVDVEGRRVPVLAPPDALAYHALHLLRHLLRGDARIPSLYEMAWFLEHHAEDSNFWRCWRALHPDPLRRIQAIAFSLAEEWFDCRTGETAGEEMAALPEDVRAWIGEHAASPVESQFRPGKAELWLNLLLVESARDKWSVVRRRLAPPVPPKRAGHTAYLVERLIHHTRALVPTLATGARWWARGLGRPYWTFFGASALYNFGLFVFFLLYNLYLLDRGYQEGFLGLVTGSMVAGNIAGTLPGGALANRLGLKRSLLAGFLGVPVISALRAVAGGEAALVALAFLAGFAASIWFVSVAPAIAQLAPERKRSVAFSLFFASGVGLGALAGLVGGRLPGWIAGGPAQAKQMALLGGCLVAGLSALPAARLRFEVATSGPETRQLSSPLPNGRGSESDGEPRPLGSGKRVFPRGAFLTRFLIAIGLWNLATGAFNPFFSAYFARHLRAAVDEIGLLFSGAQLAQAGALLLAPVVLRAWGAVRGIAGMQLAAGLALAALAGARAGAPAALAYTGYMVFQWMSEPGLYTLLMGRVGPHEQGSASALNFLVIFSAQAAAAALAGAGIARFGYPAALAAASGAAIMAGLLFRWLLGPFARPSPADNAPA